MSMLFQAQTSKLRESELKFVESLRKDSQSASANYERRIITPISDSKLLTGPTPWEVELRRDYGISPCSLDSKKFDFTSPVLLRQDKFQLSSEKKYLLSPQAQSLLEEYDKFKKNINQTHKVMPEAKVENPKSYISPVVQSIIDDVARHRSVSLRHSEFSYQEKSNSDFSLTNKHLLNHSFQNINLSAPNIPTANLPAGKHNYPMFELVTSRVTNSKVNQSTPKGKELFNEFLITNSIRETDDKENESSSSFKKEKDLSKLNDELWKLSNSIDTKVVPSLFPEILKGKPEFSMINDSGHFGAPLPAADHEVPESAAFVPDCKPLLTDKAAKEAKVLAEQITKLALEKISGIKLDKYLDKKEQIQAPDSESLSKKVMTPKPAAAIDLVVSEKKKEEESKKPVIEKPTTIGNEKTPSKTNATVSKARKQLGNVNNKLQLENIEPEKLKANEGHSSNKFSKRKQDEQKEQLNNKKKIDSKTVTSKKQNYNQPQTEKAVKTCSKIEVKPSPRARRNKSLTNIQIPVEAQKRDADESFDLDKTQVKKQIEKLEGEISEIISGLFSEFIQKNYTGNSNEQEGSNSSDAIKPKSARKSVPSIAIPTEVSQCNPLETSFQRITNEINKVLKNLKMENDLQSEEAAGILTARLDEYVKETVNQSIADLKEKKNIDLSEKREELNNSIDRVVTQKTHEMISRVLGKDSILATPNRFVNLKTPENKRERLKDYQSESEVVIPIEAPSNADGIKTSNLDFKKKNKENEEFLFLEEEIKEEIEKSSGSLKTPLLSYSKMEETEAENAFQSRQKEIAHSLKKIRTVRHQKNGKSQQFFEKLVPQKNVENTVNAKTGINYQAPAPNNININTNTISTKTSPIRSLPPSSRLNEIAESRTFQKKEIEPERVSSKTVTSSVVESSRCNNIQLAKKKKEILEQINSIDKEILEMELGGKERKKSEEPPPAMTYKLEEVPMISPPRSRYELPTQSYLNKAKTPSSIGRVQKKSTKQRDSGSDEEEEKCDRSYALIHGKKSSRVNGERSLGKVGKRKGRVSPDNNGRDYSEEYASPGSGRKSILIKGSSTSGKKALKKSAVSFKTTDFMEIDELPRSIRSPSSSNRKRNNRRKTSRSISRERLIRQSKKSFEERNKKWIVERELWIKMQKEKKLEEEMKECTFQPKFEASNRDYQLVLANQLEENKLLKEQLNLFDFERLQEQLEIPVATPKKDGGLSKSINNKTKKDTSKINGQSQDRQQGENLSQIASKPEFSKTMRKKSDTMAKRKSIEEPDQDQENKTTEIKDLLGVLLNLTNMIQTKCDDDEDCDEDDPRKPPLSPIRERVSGEETMNSDFSRIESVSNLPPKEEELPVHPQKMSKKPSTKNSKRD